MKLEFPTKKTVVWSKSSSRTALLYNEFIQVSLRTFHPLMQSLTRKSETASEKTKFLHGTEK